MTAFRLDNRPVGGFFINSGKGTNMKKLFFLISALSIICITANVSHGSQYWAKTYGGIHWDIANSIQQISDSGYIVAGATDSYGSGNADALVLKLDSNGNVIWQKTYGGSGYDVANFIQQTTDGGYIVAGITESFGAGGKDFWVLRLARNGDIIWQKTYGGSGLDAAILIQQTTDDGYIVTGITESFGAGGKDALILKLDNSGNVIWQKTYGGSGDDRAQCIQQTTDGGYVVAGYTSSFGADIRDFWVLKTGMFILG
jgi:hypothetical protein